MVLSLSAVARSYLTGQQLEKDGSLNICSINEPVAEVFSMVGFDTIIIVFETRELGLKGLSWATRRRQLRIAGSGPEKV